MRSRTLEITISIFSALILTPAQVSLLEAELGPTFQIETADQLDKDRSCFV